MHTFYVQSLKINGTRCLTPDLAQLGLLGSHNGCGPVVVAKRLLGFIGKDFKRVPKKDVFGSVNSGYKINPKDWEKTWVSLVDENDKCYYIAFTLVSNRG